MINRRNSSFCTAMSTVQSWRCSPEHVHHHTPFCSCDAQKSNRSAAQKLHLGGRVANLIEKDSTRHVSHLLLSIPAAIHTPLCLTSCAKKCVQCAALTGARESIKALLLCWYEISSLLMSELHLVPQHVYV